MGYYVKYKELQAAQSAIINQINQWSNELEQVKKQVQAVAQMQEIKGDTANSIKSYMQEIHLPLIQAMQNVLSQYMTKMLLYCNEYYKLDTKLNAAMRQDRLDDQILVIQTRTGAFEEIEGRVGEGVGMASGLASVSMPSGDRITNSYDQLKQDTTTLMNKIGYCEYLHLNKDFKLIEDMLLGILQIIHKQSGKETVTITAYQAGSIEKTPEFHKLKEASAKQSIELNGSTEELEDAINRYAQKQQERDLADERKKEGQGQLINGILISAGAIVGAAAIIMSFGTATPVVVGACAFGMTPGLYGMSLANEGVNKVILGKEGDALTVAMNPIRDTIFASNPQLYYTIGEVSTMTITIAAPLSQTASLAMKASTSVSKALVVEAGRTAVSSMVGTVTTNEIYKRTNNELLSTLTGATVGSISYAGMLKFDSMRNLSGYYKTSKVTNVTKNANLDTKNFVSRFGDMDEKDLIRYELFLKEGSSAGLTKAEINALKNVDKQLLLKKMDYDDILRISGQNSKSGSKTAKSVDNGLRNTVKPGDFNFIGPLKEVDAARLANWTKPDGSIWWPPNDGAVSGTEKKVTLRIGKEFGRIGRDSGIYVAPPNTAPEKLALKPGTDISEYKEYKVIKDIPGVQQAKVASWFDMPGGGIQYKLPASIKDLIDGGYIELIIK